MQTRLLATVAGIAVMAGCATTPQATAEGGCMDLARQINVEFLRIEKTTAVADGFDVQMRLKDGLAREFSATCRYAGGKTSWATPLPNFAPLYLRGGAGR